MKRDTPTHERRQVAKAFRPWLFWWSCDVCDRQFVREPGWRMKQFIGPEHFQWLSVCAECCPTEPEAYKRMTGRAP